MILEERFIHWHTWFASLDVWQVLHSPLIPLFLDGCMPVSEAEVMRRLALDSLFPSPCHGWGRLCTACAHAGHRRPLIHMYSLRSSILFLLFFQRDKTVPLLTSPPHCDTKCQTGDCGLASLWEDWDSLGKMSSALAACQTAAAGASFTVG